MLVTTTKVIITCFVIYAVVVDASANRARRRRRSHTLNENAQSNGLNGKPEARQQPLPQNSQVLNGQGKNFGSMQGSRQYYPQNQQYGGWSGMQGQYNPYQSYGSGYQYNAGQMGPSFYGGQSYQNPNYGGYNSGYGGMSNNMNRPGYSNYNPSYGGYSGGYFWNSASKSTTSIFYTLFISITLFYIGSFTI